MRKIFQAFSLSFSMLTIIPFFKVHNFYKGINGYATMFYPIVGFLIGSFLYLTYLLLTPYIPQQHLKVIIFTLWILITGALHLDGLSDTIDGIFVNKTKALAVMKDPSIGGMGMIFSISFLLLKVSSLINLDKLYLLPIILMLSRFNATLAIYLFAYITPNGMGKLAKKELNKTQVFISIFYVSILVILFKTPFLLLFSLISLFIIKLFFLKRYGGFTGDIYGFTIEMTELILLNILILEQF